MISNWKIEGSGSAAAIVCLVGHLASPAVSSDTVPATAFAFAGETVGLAAAGQPETAPETKPYHLLQERAPAELTFDLGGSETRKLQIQLDQPLLLTTTTQARLQENGSGMIGLDATLNLPLNERFSVGGGMREQIGDARFYSLGRIQCLNGTLRPDSYTASDCHFVNDAMASTESRRLSLGGRYELGNASASIDWFTQDASVKIPGGRHLNRIVAPVTAGDGLLSPNLMNPLIANSGSWEPLQLLNTEASGVNLNFNVGITTDTSGDLRLGLAFTRVLDAEYSGIYSNNPNPLSWTLARPFNAGRLDLEWSRGSFSSGIQAFYRDSVDFLNRSSLDGLTTFDVYFTWRTPWRANLTVGATNVLNGGTESGATTDSQPADPFESIYGRIPYVRYKQDL